LSLAVSHSVEVLKPTTLDRGSDAAAETDESSGDVIWLIIAIVVMVVFVCLFSYLIYKERLFREHEMKIHVEKHKAAQQGKKFVKTGVK
jgi:heme/copper-type cytochrome/quinol oxidase subunit 2